MSKKRALRVNQVFAYRLRDARLSKQWNQQDLADAMTRIGHPINRATIAKIEAGARGVGGEVHGPRPDQKTQPRPASLEEAIAFAAALDVPPPSLFLPLTREDDVALAAGLHVDADTAHAWARGEHPLAPEDGQFYRFQTFPRRPSLADLEALGIRFIQEPPKENP